MHGGFDFKIYSTRKIWGRKAQAHTILSEHDFCCANTHDVRVHTRGRAGESELIKIDFYREKIYYNNIFFV